MKRFLLLLTVTLCVSVRAATPSFQDFDLNQFSTNSFKVRIKSGALVTNMTGSFVGNAYFLNLFWLTNAQSTITINAGKALEVLATNNNISITGYSGIDGTNGNTFTRIYTNTAGSAAVKSITFPVGTLMLSSPYTNVVYLTNQGVFSGVIYPGFGTNGTWTGN